MSQEEDIAQSPEPVKLRAAREDNDGNGLQRPQAGSPQTVMVMAEMEEPRATYVLARGQYNMPDKSKAVQPGVPSFLGKPSAQPTNRLELASWLVSDNHPLTSRVAVNRIWQQFFGVGLVKTSENFGLQGELPSHPELLDWLATSLVDADWNLHTIHKLIVMSTTYQQSSRQMQKHREHDPENRLLSRGPRFRLHPFALRDQALMSSGLLYEQIGGPSAKPYMPAKIWRAISNNTYKQDTGSNLYRRSIYTYWRRTIPPPTMLAFNAAEREVCIVRKERTNTPLQALTMMNNKTFIEASRVLAERMLQHDSSPQKAIAHGFQLMTARVPTSQESTELLEAYVAFRSEYDSDIKSAKQLTSVGAKPSDAGLDLSQHAAMTMVASLIMNLDETVTKE